MNTVGNELEMVVSANYVTPEQIAKKKWRPVLDVPAMFFAKVGAAVMLNRKRLVREPFLLDNNTMAYSLRHSAWDAEFAKALFGMLDLTSLVQVGALPSYNAGDVEAMRVRIPPLSEQRAIGAFFRDIDNLITLRQRERLPMQKMPKAVSLRLRHLLKTTLNSPPLVIPLLATSAYRRS